MRERREPCELCGTGTYADVGYSGISVCDHCGAEWTYIEGYSPSTNQFSKTRAEVADLKSRLDTAWGDVGAMQKVVDSLTAQRDEARRDLCMSEAIDRLHEANPNAPISYGESRRIAREIAAEYGWDCFKEGGGA